MMASALACIRRVYRPKAPAANSARVTNPLPEARDSRRPSPAWGDSRPVTTSGADQVEAAVLSRLRSVSLLRLSLTCEAIFLTRACLAPAARRVCSATSFTRSMRPPPVEAPTPRPSSRWGRTDPRLQGADRLQGVSDETQSHDFVRRHAVGLYLLPTRRWAAIRHRSRRSEGAERIVASLRPDKPAQARVFAIDGSEFTAGQTRGCAGSSTRAAERVHAARRRGRDAPCRGPGAHQGPRETVRSPTQTLPRG